MRLVAAHSWDVAGALRAGCAAAFVSRPGKVLDPLAPAPDVVGPDLEAVAAGIVAAEAERRWSGGTPPAALTQGGFAGFGPPPLRPRPSPRQPPPPSTAGALSSLPP